MVPLLFLAGLLGQSCDRQPLLGLSATRIKRANLPQRAYYIDLKLDPRNPDAILVALIDMKQAEAIDEYRLAHSALWSEDRAAWLPGPAEIEAALNPPFSFNAATDTWQQITWDDWRVARSFGPGAYERRVWRGHQFTPQPDSPIIADHNHSITTPGPYAFEFLTGQDDRISLAVGQYGPCESNGAFLSASTPSGPLTVQLHHTHQYLPWGTTEFILEGSYRSLSHAFLPPSDRYLVYCSNEHYWIIPTPAASGSPP